MDSGKQSADAGAVWPLALGHYQAGRLDEAERMCHRVLGAEPRQADALHLLGAIAHQRGNHDQAVELIEEAVGVEPSRPDYLNTLGVAYQALGRVAQAEDCFRAALSVKVDYPAAHNNLGIALRNLARLQEAEDSFREAVRLQPGYAEAHNNLGNVLRELGRLEEAERNFRLAIRTRPDYAEAHGNLGIVLRGLGRLDDAERSARRAIALKPDYAEAHNDLGAALFGLGRLPEAERSYRAALALDPSLAIAQANLAYLLNCVSGRSAAEIYAEHREFARRFCPLADTRPHRNAADPERRLRIGYVSADLRHHSVAFFIEPVLASHDHGKFEIFCYCNLTRSDSVTQRLKSCAEHWREVFALDDDALVKLIREDGIDILVDLSGLSANNRLTAFARKPAPVQVTWLGYPNTTGLAAMDYRLTDSIADPEGATERFHVEKLVRLANGFLCYRPPSDSPQVGELPSLRAGHVTFGCFNHLPKLTPEMIALWARLLGALPGARLLLKSFGLAAQSARRALRARFAQHGIGAERLELCGPVDALAGHLGRYNEVDIALDVFPYNGTTTTCEALWMGVPVVSLAGRTHASRVGASLLHCVGLSEFVAQTPDQYLDLAAGLARDPARLAALRAGLRERMRASPLADAQRYTRDLEAAYRYMWRSWCAGRPRGSVLRRVATTLRKYIAAP